MLQVAQMKWKRLSPAAQATSIGALLGVAVTLVIGALALVGMELPVVSMLVFLPAVALVWLFILGDNGSYPQMLSMSIAVAAIINALIGGLLATLVRRVVQRPFQFSLKMMFAVVTLLMAAIALPAWSIFSVLCGRRESD